MDGSRRQHACVFGLGWGDEGKGKIVDLLCPAFDIVVRFNGGANAGHTVCTGDQKFALHLLPTGVLRENTIGIIGPGVVVDPHQLLVEIDELAARGIDVQDKLKISDRAHLVLEYHKAEDRLSEQAAGKSGMIGTTARGIGPCYADKMKRSTAIRFADLLQDSNLEKRLRRIVEVRKATLTAAYGSDDGLDPEAILEGLAIARQRLAACVCNTTAYLHDAIDAGRSILFEGANGVLLDIDHGTYPFVTSSSPGPHGIGPGAGVPPAWVTRLIGVTKSYATRVGSGPFVAELKDATGDRIREAGNEYGTTTGRPRRCGWFDAVATRYSVQVSGATDIAMMHLDTLSGFDEIGVCTGYRCDGETIMTPPSDCAALERCEPVIELLPGWSEDLRSIRRYEDLPDAVKDYLKRIESMVGAGIAIIGVGPDRAETIIRGPLQEMIGQTESQIA